jgi:molecular chaperone GrpE
MCDFMMRTGGLIMQNLEELQKESGLAEKHGAHTGSGKIPLESLDAQPDSVTSIETPVPSIQVNGASDGTANPHQFDIDEKLDSVQHKIVDLQDAYLEVKDELGNFHRYVQEDILHTHNYAIEDYSKTLSLVKDRLDAALNIAAPSIDSMREDIEIILKQLDDLFKQCNVIEIAPMSGENFDPIKHHAISILPADPHNTITGMLQIGYMVGDRVLRPALVTVTKELTAKEFPRNK